MTDQEIRALWLIAAELWPTFEIPPPDSETEGVKLQVWHRQLDDLTAELVDAALDALSGDRFAPPLGQVRKEAFALAAKAAGAPTVPEADEAWGEVVSAFSLVGRYSIPKWSHPAIASTVKAIGWVEMCNSTDQGVLRGQFVKLYGVCRDRTVREAVPLPPGVAGYLGRSQEALASAALALKRVDDVLDVGDGGR